MTSGAHRGTPASPVQDGISRGIPQSCRVVIVLQEIAKQAAGKAEFREFLQLGSQAELHILRSLDRRPPGSVIDCYLLLHLPFPIRDRWQVFVCGERSAVLRKLVGQFVTVVNVILQVYFLSI